jgi:hypothetical protein
MLASIVRVASMLASIAAPPLDPPPLPFEEAS